jgi:hypothetical protein
MKTIITLALAIGSITGSYADTMQRCKAYCVNVNYDSGRITLAETLTNQTKYGREEIFFYIESLCSKRGGNHYLVTNFDVKTQNKIEESFSRSSNSQASVHGRVELRKGFLGIGRKEGVALGGNKSISTSTSSTYSKESDFEFALHIATPENACIEYEYDPQTPVRYVNNIPVY